MDLGKNGGSEDVKETNNLTAHMLDWAKEKVAAGTVDLPKNEQTAPKSGWWEIGAVIVVAVRGDGLGEVKARLFEDAADAERFVETLVEGNVDQERIAVLWAKAVEMNVTYRPVVQLAVDGNLSGSDDEDQQP